jgi:hypothetical protein
VSFWNGANSQTGDNGLFWDNTNKRLGVGTSSPLNKFYVYSTTIADGISIDGTQFPSIVLRTNGVVRGYAPFVTTQNGGFFSDSLFGDMGFRSESNRVLFGVGSGASTMQISGSSVRITGTLLTTGNVGIGTTNPQARLDVRAQGALSTDIAFRVRNSADTANLITVQGNGNIGIGVDNPLDRLHISQIVGGSNNVIRMTSNPGHANIITFRNADGSIQGGFLATGSTFSYGTYLPNQCNLASGSGGSGGVGLRVSNVSNLNFYGGNVDPDFGVNYFRLFGATGNVQIQNGGTYTDIASARLAVNSTTQGFLPPRMTNAQRLAIASPAIGLMVYCTDATEGLYINKSTGWTFII